MVEHLWWFRIGGDRHPPKLLNRVTLSASFGSVCLLDGHPERSEGSGSMDAEILRFAQDDSQDTFQVRSQEVFSPNVYTSSSWDIMGKNNKEARRQNTWT